MIVAVCLVLHGDDGGFDSPNGDFRDAVADILELRGIQAGLDQARWTRKAHEFFYSGLDDARAKVVAVDDVLSNFGAILVLAGLYRPAFGARLVEFGWRDQRGFKRKRLGLRLSAETGGSLDFLGNRGADNRQRIHIRDGRTVGSGNRRKGTGCDGRGGGLGGDGHGGNAWNKSGGLAASPKDDKSWRGIPVGAVTGPVHREAGGREQFPVGQDGSDC